MLERLPLMQGALTARATLEAQQEQQQSNSGTVSGVPTGTPSGAGRPSNVSGVAVTTRPGDQDVQFVESTGENLVRHEALSGLIEYVQVSSSG